MVDDMGCCGNLQLAVFYWGDVLAGNLWEKAWLGNELKRWVFSNGGIFDIRISLVSMIGHS